MLLERYTVFRMNIDIQKMRDLRIRVRQGRTLLVSKHLTRTISFYLYTSQEKKKKKEYEELLTHFEVQVLLVWSEGRLRGEVSLLDLLDRGFEVHGWVMCNEPFGLSNKF